MVQEQKTYNAIDFIIDKSQLAKKIAKGIIIRVSYHSTFNIYKYV